MFKRNWNKKDVYKKTYLTWKGNNLTDIFSEHSTCLPSTAEVYTRRNRYPWPDILSRGIIFSFLFFFLILHRNSVTTLTLTLTEKGLLPKRG